MTLPALGKCNYNGVEFPSNVETTEFRGTPTYSSDGRTITHTVFSLTLRATFTDEEEIGTDSQMINIIPRLTQPASKLVYDGRGFGNIVVNAGGTFDVAWGPKPRVLSLKPIGAGLAVEMTWQVEWSVPTCNDAVYKNFPMEFTYKITYDIDKSGYTVRHYSGKVVIPQTRQSPDNRIPYTSADAWREKVTPLTITGFERISRNFELSEDRRTLTFSIVDRQLPPWAPPEGCIEAEASHTYTSDAGKIFNWTGTITGKYELARGVNVGVAVNAFFALLKDRIGIARGNIKGFDPGKKGDTKAVVLPAQFAMEETNLYGKMITSFRCVYRVLPASLSEILRAGGMWRPLPRAASAPYDQWEASVGVGVAQGSSRGHANLKFTPGEDRIVDLCAVKPNPNVSQNAPPPGFIGGVPANDLYAAFPPPTPEGSWLYYNSALTIESDNGVVTAKPLPDKKEIESKTAQDSWNALAGGASMPGTDSDGSVPYAPTPNAGDTGTQQRITPTLYLRLTGQAQRAMYPIPVPEIFEIFGVKPTLISRVDRGEGFTQGIVGDMLYPIYHATFNLLYVLGKVPVKGGAINPPGNPLITLGIMTVAQAAKAAAAAEVAEAAPVAPPAAPKDAAKLKKIIQRVKNLNPYT